MSDNTCQPSDSVTLYFGGAPYATGQDSILMTIEMHTVLPENGLSPLRRWQRFYRSWTVSRLGPVDSVRLSPNYAQLKAYWRTTEWWADLTIDEEHDGQRYTFVSIQLLCQSLKCRRVH